MKKDILPQANDWNRFWKSEQTQTSSNVSWSKRRIMNILTPYVGVGKKALDAGCGSGFFSRYFCDSGMETVSLDYSEESLKMAQAFTQGRAKIIQADLLSDDLKTYVDERFDVIFSDGLLEHFEPDQQNKILKNFSSLLSPDGVIVTFVPNRWSPWELIRPFFMPGIKEVPFVLNQLVALNQHNGLKVIRQGGINTFPFAFSPDKFVGHLWGMLLYTIAKKND